MKKLLLILLAFSLACYEPINPVTRPKRTTEYSLVRVTCRYYQQVYNQKTKTYNWFYRTYSYSTYMRNNEYKSYLMPQRQILREDCYISRRF